jgi:hypothetical protein
VGTAQLAFYVPTIRKRGGLEVIPVRGKVEALGTTVFTGTGAIDFEAGTGMEGIFAVDGVWICFARSVNCRHCVVPGAMLGMTGGLGTLIRGGRLVSLATVLVNMGLKEATVF